MVNIIQAPRASQPYPWRRFQEWLAVQGFTYEEQISMIENGIAPNVTMAVGFVLDEETVYPGLPDPNYIGGFDL